MSSPKDDIILFLFPNNWGVKSLVTPFTVLRDQIFPVQKSENKYNPLKSLILFPVSYTHLRAHET